MSQVSHVRLLRRSEVETMAGVKKSFIYQRMKEGTFPRPVRLGSGGLRWRIDELEAWIESRERHEQAAAS